MFTCEKNIRKALSKEEREALNVIVETAEQAGKRAAFTMSGSITVPAESGQSLYYHKGPEDETTSRLLLPASANDLVKLADVASPSYHGAGTENVLDIDYRCARELKAEQYALNFDPLIEILPKIQQLHPDEKSRLEATMYKLNVYSEGGFFKSHRDTPKDDKHIGSLVVCLPSDFKGGELVVRQDGKVEIFDWSESCSKGDIGWCFLYSDCEHEVLPVTSGARLTLAYDVYSRPPTAFAHGADLARSLPEARDIVQSPQTEALFHQPLSKVLIVSSIKLRSSSASKRKGYHREYKGVKAGWILSNRCDYGLYSYTEDYDSDSDNSCERKTREDLIWISKTGRQFLGGAYAHYGNEASVSHVYVSGVILITIPAKGPEGTKKAATKRKKT